MKKMKYLGFTCVCSLLLAACGSESEPITFPPTVTTGNASDIYRGGATLSGSVQNPENAAITEFGIMYSEHQHMEVPTEVPSVADDMTSFSVDLRSLEPGQTYYYCAYASSGFSMVKGEVKTFSTTTSNAPIFNDMHCNVSYETGFDIEAQIEDIGDNELLLCGFCYKLADGTGSEPTIADETVYMEEVASQFTFSLDGLLPENTYLVRAFAGNSQGVGYSETIEVTTQKAEVPILSAVEVVESTPNSVTVTASVWKPETEELSEVGFCWSMESNEPTYKVNGSNHINVIEQLADGKFTCTISGLTPQTTYYIRAYAVGTPHGENYGKVLEFTTDAVVIPEVGTGDGGIDDLPTENL